jgi:hypothetical protein
MFLKTAWVYVDTETFKDMDFIETLNTVIDMQKSISSGKCSVKKIEVDGKNAKILLTYNVS